MLKQRVVTALVLVAALILILFMLPRPWATVAFSVVAALAAWEWSRLSPQLPVAARGFFPLWILGCCGVVWLYPDLQYLLCALAALFWLFVPIWLHQRWPIAHRGTGILVGTVVIVPAWIGMVRLDDMGPWVLLAAMALVWVADISAYFVGRAFGRHKLAPAISPGKTWEGAAGAVFGSLVYVFVLREFTPLQFPASSLQVAGETLVLVSVSIVGDLFESMIKRHAGQKDSSQLLPGHGGVLDRIDSLTSTLPVIVAVVGMTRP